MELSLYRHKQHKDLYLVRIPAADTHGEDTKFYRVTKHPGESISSLLYYGHEFLYGYNHYPNNWTEYTFTKEVNCDGYEGMVKKTEKLYIKDFELVTLVEK